MFRFKVSFNRGAGNEWNLFRVKADGGLVWQHFSEYEGGDYRGMNNYCCSGTANREDIGR